ncbi:hypothetical protein F5Y16DRAFT_367526 [Xylariaceae sp. FL0255]|nr:hypothetical protein F5Y16DRAFT_367526 [Xylariaceae sp. FL0255]
MPTTPRSSSPTIPQAKMPQTPDRTVTNNSMVAEPPTTKVEQGTQTPEDVTVRIAHPQASQGSPSRKQHMPKAEPNTSQNAINARRDRPGAQTPETQKRRSDRSVMTSPGHLNPFNWDDFNERYEKALQEADANEKQMLEEFERLVKYFNIWASASSSHDTERAVKRLQTRERYVQISEQSLMNKKKHLSEVVAAFQSALALLSTT